QGDRGLPRSGTGAQGGDALAGQTFRSPGGCAGPPAQLGRQGVRPRLPAAAGGSEPGNPPPGDGSSRVVGPEECRASNRPLPQGSVCAVTRGCGPDARTPRG